LIAAVLLSACDDYLHSLHSIATPETLVSDDRLPGLWLEAGSSAASAILVTSLGNGRYMLQQGNDLLIASLVRLAGVTFLELDGPGATRSDFTSRLLVVISIEGDTLRTALLDPIAAEDSTAAARYPVPVLVVDGDIVLRGPVDGIHGFLADYVADSVLVERDKYVRVSVGGGPSFRPQRVFTSWLSVRDEVDSNQVTVIDVGRHDSMFEAGHVPGAQPVGLEALVISHDGLSTEFPGTDSLKRLFESLGVRDNRPVLLYGDPLAAARAFVTLDMLGHPDVRILDGGLAAWKEHRKVQVGTARPVEWGSFTPRPDSNRIIDGPELRTLLGRADVPIFDARATGEFTGEVRSKGASKSGHIPGARSAPWQSLLSSDKVRELDWESAGRLLEVPEYAPVVVVYCNSGLQASYLYAVARELGYPVRLYDGSFTDWSRRKGFPVER
jgi:thiosulfate/3-mercaptopyruvate sulfurtransferase